MDYEWISQFENTIKENFNINEEENYNKRGFNFPFPLKININEDTGIWLSIDKTFIINNKKLWILYLPVPENYDAIGIKTDENTGNQRVKRYRVIQYKNNNHKEYLINKKDEYTGIYNWVINYRRRLNEFNNYENHYLIISTSINRTNQQKWNNLGHENGLWLISSNAKEIINIINYVLK